jgi:hypothetical protein
MTLRGTMLRAMDPSALDTFRAFRNSLYDCLHRRADALFELTDALLTAQQVPSPVHLSLQPSHRRGWGSLYNALSRGRIDAQALRRLLAHYPLAGSETTTPVYAVDVSVWDRCDAECSPERGFYYHPSCHSAGQPIVAGSGPTSSSHSSISFARAGLPPWTWSACVLRRTPTRLPLSRLKRLCASRMRARKSRRGPLLCSSSTLATIL